MSKGHPLKVFIATHDITTNVLAEQFGRKSPSVSKWIAGEGSANQGDMAKLKDHYSMEIVSDLSVAWVRWIRKGKGE